MTEVQFQVFTQDQVNEMAAQYCAEQAVKAVQSYPQVLLLLSGGSAIEMYAQMIVLLPPATSLANLTVSLVDERYGAAGHADSNEAQLRAKGVVDQLEKSGARFFGMLSNQKMTGEEMAAEAGRKFAEIYANSPYVLVFAGVGDDGHTLGWLPTQTEEKFHQLYDSANYVTYYEVDPADSDNPFGQRITCTARAIKEANTVVVFAKGDKKKAALLRIKEGGSPIHTTPALGLKMVKDKVVVLTDQQL